MINLNTFKNFSGKINLERVFQLSQNTFYDPQIPGRINEVKRY